MTKHLSRHGNSLALVIDRGILEMLDIDEKTTLSVSTDGKTLFVSKQQEPGRKAAVEKAVERSFRKYGKMYRRLADR
jgi:antitoxin component of MazEF toxin-antitoxin module